MINLVIARKGQVGEEERLWHTDGQNASSTESQTTRPIVTQNKAYCGDSRMRI